MTNAHDWMKAHRSNQEGRRAAMMFETIEEVVEEIVWEAAGIAGDPVSDWETIRDRLEKLVPRYSGIIREMNDADDGRWKVKYCSKCGEKVFFR